MTAQAVTIDAAAGDEPTRTITGIAVPYGVDAIVSGGQQVRIEPGALPTDGPAPRLLEQHDTNRVVGMVTARQDTEDGMLFSAKIAQTSAGDDLLALLEMGAYDSVSIGIEPIDVEQDGPTLVVKAANWSELSVVYEPAFADAKITQVAAAAEAEPEEEPTTDPQEDPQVSEDKTPELVEAAAEAPTALPQMVFAQPRKVEVPTAAEWICAAVAGGDHWHRINEQLRAAAPDVTTTNNDGVLPEPVVGTVYDNYIAERPVIDACPLRAMPGGGKVFIRPSVSTHTSMGAQSAELATLTAGEFQVAENQVEKLSRGGYVEVSEQIIDWSEPSIVNLILEDMGKIYANDTDNVAADNLVAGATTTQNFTDANIADPTEWISWVADASTTVLTSSNGNKANTLFLSTDIWASLIKLEDSSGRPLFPTVGPQNSYGQLMPGEFGGTAFGFNIVVDRNFAADTMILGDPTGFEVFETTKGFLSVDNASNRSRTISWLGYFATLMIDADKFVKAAFV
jgi:hypothetical protein